MKRLVLPAAAILLILVAAGKSAVTNVLIIHANQGQEQISRNLYGQFAEQLGRGIYDGIWVGTNSDIPNTRGIRNDTVEALKKIHVPVIRWPGGCYADQYHWEDGIGPRDQRPVRINTTWGGVADSNQFGSHEFMDFCEQVGASPYLAINMGSGSVSEMMSWIEYLTATTNSFWSDLRRKNGRAEPWKIPFVGVGNESWGCGGSMTAEYYADNFRRYNEFLRDFPGNKIYRVASGSLPDDTNWTELLMRKVGSRMSGLSLHYYTFLNGNWPPTGSATKFAEAGWFAVLRNAWRMDEVINRHAAIMDRYDPQKKVGLIVDEWGTWFDSEPGNDQGILYQQNTLRDALVAGITLNQFNNRCDRVKMACIAQLANVLQSMILTDGNKFLVTPTYWVFEMYVPHQDATLLPVELRSADYGFDGDTMPAVSASASRDAEGKICVTLCNANPREPAPITVTLTGAKIGSISGRVLTAGAMNARNTFDHPDAVKPVPFNGAALTSGGFAVILPPMSVVALICQ